MKNLNKTLVKYVHKLLFFYSLKYIITKIMLIVIHYECLSKINIWLSDWSIYVIICRKVFSNYDTKGIIVYHLKIF